MKKHRKILKAAAIPAILTLGMGTLVLMPGLSSVLELQLNGGSPLFTLLTGHFVHHSLRHYIYDAAVFLALGAVVVRDHGLRSFLILTLGSALTVSLLLPLLAPQFASYRGISAVDTALVALVACRFLRDGNRLFRLAAAGTLIGMMLKFSYEIAFAQNVFVQETSFVPVVAAHLIGALWGILQWNFENGKRSIRKKLSFLFL